MAHSPEMSPKEAADRTLKFIEGGVTGKMVPDALIAIRARNVFGIEGARGAQQQDAYDRMGRAYRQGFLEMGRRVADALEDPREVFPLPDSVRKRIVIFDPALGQ